MGIDTIRHESRNGAGRVIFAGIAGALQVIEDLLVNVPEMLPLGEVIKVNFVNFVNHLTHQLAGLHVVVCVLKDIADYTAAVAFLAGNGEFLELGK